MRVLAALSINGTAVHVSLVLLVVSLYRILASRWSLYMWPLAVATHFTDDAFSMRGVVF